MKTFHSPLFGEILEPENFLELLTIVFDLSRTEYLNIMFWRGQGDINWPVHSGAYRRLLDSVNEGDEMGVSQYESVLIRRAKHKGYGSNEGLPISDMEILAKLQHHGAATRLVDFSKNILVALWFCVDSEPDKTGLLLGVHTHYIGGSVEGVIGDGEDYETIMGGIRKKDYPTFLEPPVVSKRISAQHAVFLYSSVISDEKGSLILPKDNNATLFFAISPELKKSCRRILIDHFDIRTETLFPDLDGFSFHANNASSSYDDIFRW